VNAVLEAIGKFLSSWKPWVVVAPWERGVRVRLGKTAVQLEPGFHLRIPVLDRVLLVNTRLRVTTSAQVTIAGSSATKVRVRMANIGFSIVNPLAAIERYNSPQHAICALVQAEMSAGLDADRVRAAVESKVAGSGIVIEFLRYQDDVEIRAYRLLQGTWCTESSDQQHGNEAVVRY
jgi:hypothetical protein